MNQSLALVSLVVRDYDDAIAFYRDTLGFQLLEDKPLGGGKRWVVVRPRGAGSAGLLLAKAAGAAQEGVVGQQTGGRVFLFLHTDDIARDWAHLKARGVAFVQEPTQAPYGEVAVFQDLYGNLWDLIQPAP